MAVQARYVHTNLIARDCGRLIQFYCRVFGCQAVPPPRELAGAWLAASTGVPGAEIRGQHLRLPGQGPEGPTLEIFQYNRSADRLPPAANRPGFGHIAFAVEDVAAAREAVLEAGGRAFGEQVTAEIPGAGRLTFLYVADPEGNLIELQRWES